MSVKEKISYLKGILEAYKITRNQDKKENKVLLAVLDVLEEISKEVDELKEQQNDLEEYVEKIDDDLANLEENMLDDEDEDFDELECPHCKETIYIDEALGENEDELICPICNQKIEL